MHLKTLVTSLVVTSAMALSAASAGEIQVMQKAKKFDPKKVSAAAGDTIVFVNKDSFTHNLYSKKGQKFDSGVMKPGDVYKLAVKGGKFTVRCAIHPKMKLKVKSK